MYSITVFTIINNTTSNLIYDIILHFQTDISPDILRSHVADLCRLLNISEPTLLSLTNELYSKNVIDSDVKIEVIRKGGSIGANILLTHVEMKIKQNSEHRDVVQKAMEKEQFLHEITQKMKRESR